MLTCEMYEGNAAYATAIAAAVEVFHNFTLVHDDIVDGASMRRGKPSVHEKFGLNTALLAGDGLLLFAYEYLGHLPASLFSKTTIRMNKVALLILEGQQMDLEFEKRKGVSIDGYLKMIEYKTAALLGLSLQLGAITSAADDDELQKLYRLGVLIGLAYQIQDDYLDAFGNEKLFGKTIGGDISRGKKSYLHVVAYQRANAQQYKKLKHAEMLHNGSKIKAMIELYKSIGADAVAQQHIQALNAEATEVLHSLNVPVYKKSGLQSLLHALQKRVA